MRFPRPLVAANRSGHVTVLLVFLLPVLLGTTGLVIDTGILLTAHRQAQNAADAAALAAAMDLLSGQNTMTATATQYVQTANGLSNATVVVNVPPQQGPYAGNSNYVEVLVTVEVETWFIQVVGGPSLTIGARAVAGCETVAPPDALTLLNPNAAPGLSLNGASLVVNGSVAVNSQGAGLDQTNAAVDWGQPPYAIATGNGPTLSSSAIRVVGGVDSPGAFQTLSGGSGSLTAGVLPRPDPLRTLQTPTTSNGVLNIYPGGNGSNYSTPQQVSVTVASGQSLTLTPGVYSSIEVLGAGSGTLTFQPGIYVILGGATGRAGVSLRIETGATVVGNGVMFYSTGSDFNPTTGLPDSGDGNCLGTDPTSTNTFGGTWLSAGTMKLTPYSDPGGPLDGMLFYQRRWNTSPLTVAGNNTQDAVSGTLYARWAPCTLSGPGTFTSQFVAGSLQVGATGANTLVTLSAATRTGKAPQVYLVE